MADVRLGVRAYGRWRAKFLMKMSKPSGEGRGVDRGDTACPYAVCMIAVANGAGN